MPVPSSVVGLRTQPITHSIDARWLMAYAAGLGCHDTRYFDTTAPTPLAMHPLFPVCVEWPSVLALRQLQPLAEHVSDDEARRGVHATHDLTIVRPMRPGDEVTTVATVTGVEQRSPGAYLTMELVSTDPSGEVICRTTQGSLYLRTEVLGPQRPPPEPEAPATSLGPNEPHPPERHEVVVPIGPGDAHIYTECARIWNPIHTDTAVAAAAGLPGIILHGTATLAHAVTVGVARLAQGDPARVTRIACRFSAMVELPSPETAIIIDLSPDGRFEVRNHVGQRAITAGLLRLG